MRSPLFPAALACLLLGSPALAAEVRDVGRAGLAPIPIPQTAAKTDGDARQAEVAAAVSRALGLDDESSLAFLQARQLPNRRGRSLRYQQRYRGLPIWDQQVVVHQAPDGQVMDASGTAAFDIDPVRTPAAAARLGAAEALAIATRSVLTSDYPRHGKLENETADLVWRLENDRDLQLVYKVSFFTTLFGADGALKPTRPVVFIDAASGAIVDSYDNIQHARRARPLGTGPGGNLRTGKYRYGDGGLDKFLVTKKGDTCHLDSAQLQAEDMKNGTEATGIPFSFPCYENTYKEVNGAYSPINDAQFFGWVVVELYNKWFGIPPLGSTKLLLRVHYGKDYQNAFWNGTAMAFGDGKDRMYPLVAIDVTSHEISHGFTEKHSGLIYRDQPGGINEAYSDIAGEAAEAFFAEHHGNPWGRPLPDFLVGADFVKEPGIALRWMCDPERDGVSIGNAADFKKGMNPHLSSGVYNKAFCLLAHRKGWDVRKAFGVFLVANESYWTPRTDYQSGAEAALKAAEVLGYPADDVAWAFGEVGIELPLLTVGRPSSVFAGAKGGPFAPRSVRIPLAAPIPVFWDVSGLPAWLEVTPSNGIVRGKGAVVLSLTDKAARLNETTTATLTFHNNTVPGQKPVTRKVKIAVKKRAGDAERTVSVQAAD